MSHLQSNVNVAQSIVTWTWEEIQDDWLGGALIAEEPEVVVNAFNWLETVFGRDWIEASRQHEGSSEPSRGALPTLSVVVLGKHLALLDGASGCDALARKVRDRQPGALAELDAISLVLASAGELRVECEPAVAVGMRRPQPDFRVARPSEPWIYIEVTQPNRSVAQRNLRDATRELNEVLDTVPGRCAAEVFFLRQPTSEELRSVRPELEQICRRSGVAEVRLQGALGVVYLNYAEPGTGVLEDHGQPYTPRLGSMVGRVEDGETVRHLIVRVPYYDDRGAQFLATEAAQLPDGDPGLIMIEMSGASGGMRKWAPVLDDELALGLYDNVSAVCLFDAGFEPTEHGESWKVEKILVTNSAATHPLPEWLKTRLEAGGVFRLPRLRR